MELPKRFSLVTFFLLFAAVAANAQVLVAISGDGATTPETLFTLNQSNGAETLLMALGNGDDGETIAYNPTDGLLYHSSGISNGNRFWEAINLATTTIMSSGQFTGGPEVDDENLAMVYNPSTGRFLVTDRNENFYDTTLGGVATTLGLSTTPATIKGLAFVGSTLYGAQQPSALLHTINPATGSSTGSVAVTMAGFTVAGLNGLTTHPNTNVLYAIVRTSSPSARHLATINPATGVATFIGTLNENFAGLAFTNFSLAPPAPPAAVPTLSGGGLILTILLMAAVMLSYRRKDASVV